MRQLMRLFFRLCLNASSFLYAPLAGRTPPPPAGEGGVRFYQKILPYTRPVLGGRSPLGRAAALLARSPPPTASNVDLLCGADRHPGSPFALSGSSVGQRGIIAKTTQPAPCTCKTNYLRILMRFNIFLHFRRSFASSCHSGTCNSLNSGQILHTIESERQLA
jgi:hypothetical protein